MTPEDLMDAAAVRRHCGGISRPTMLKWRQKGFPAPLSAPHVAAELWHRGDVDEWWRAYKRATRGDKRRARARRPKR